MADRGLSVSSIPQTGAVKVRIIETPHELEMEGVKLSNMAPGSVLEVSPSIGSWLIVQGYAALEMRSSSRASERSEATDTYGPWNDRRKRR